MVLNETLQKIKAASLSRIPPEAAEIMSRTTQQLKDSGIVKMALGAGKPAPAFELTDWQGQAYSSKQILAKGPLILSFYRGSW